VVGAVAPSGRRLAEQVVAPVPRTGDPVVVELGPGTGAFTESIQRRLGGRGRHIAIELLPTLAQRLAHDHHRTDIVVGDAADLNPVLEARGLAYADVVVSGLPWSLLTAQHQSRILDAITTALAPTGAFTTFAYVHALWTPGARRLRRALEARFEEVVAGRTVWSNVPPALVYHSRRPLAHDPVAARARAGQPHKAPPVQGSNGSIGASSRQCTCANRERW
jgi:phospholipid N-methyltransferase